MKVKAGPGMKISLIVSGGVGTYTRRHWEEGAEEGEGAELGDEGVEEGGVGYGFDYRCPGSELVI